MSFSGVGSCNVHETRRTSDTKFGSLAKSKAHFVGDIRAVGLFETFPGYKPKIREEQRLKSIE